MAMERIQNKKHPELAWYNTSSSLKSSKDAKAPEDPNEAKTPVAKEKLNNRIAIRNAFTVFDQRYDPVVYSSISLRRQTLAGSIIPRINYSNRNGQNGIQYDLPKS